MAESPEDLGKEIDRLWAKVAASSLESPEAISPPPSSGPVSQEMAWEAVALLKRQQRHESRYWTEILEAKERALAAFREKQALLQVELNSLRQRVQSDEARIVGEGLEAKARVEAALAALEQEKASHDEEMGRLRVLLEQTRARWRGEAESWRREREQFDKREEQHLAELKGLHELAARAQKEAADAPRLEHSLREAKNALEKTLSELLRERQIRDDAEKEREKAVKKVEELQKHFEELSKLWEEERAQWRELWDRERSTWETQRQEFSAWEENLREERLAWQGEMKSKEAAQLAHAEQLTETLRQSAETSARLASVARRSEYEDRRGLVPGVPSRWGRRLSAVALAALIAVPAWRYLSRYHFKPVSSVALERPDATGLAFDGALLWASRWDGKLLALDPRDLRVVREAKPAVAEPYRPAALAFGGSFLWTADAAQARLVRHKSGSPEEVLAARPSPGPAPTALAFDGEALWSYDAANKTLYRHGADEATYKPYALDADAVVTAMAWIGGELWVYDAKGRELLVFGLKGESLKPRGRYTLGEQIVGMLGVKVNASGRSRRQLWILAAPSAERAAYALIRYDY